MTNKLISALLSVSMLGASAVPCMAASDENTKSNANISIVTEVNGNGVIMESVGGEIKTSTYSNAQSVDETLSEIATATPTDIPEKTAEPVTTESPEPTEKPIVTEEPETSESPAPSNTPENKPDLDSPIYNTYLFSIIKNFVEQYVDHYMSECGYKVD